MSGPPPTINLFPSPNCAAAPPGGLVQLPAEVPVLLPIRPVTRANVLHVINGEHYSGAERVQDLLALCLPAEGFAADFAALKPGRFGEVRQSSSRLVSLPMRSRVDHRSVGALKRLIRKHNYRLLHAHTPRTAIITAIAARSMQLPWIYHVHSPVSRDSKRTWQNRVNGWVERFSLRTATRVVVVAPSLMPYMLQRGVDQDRLVCVPNGVPLSNHPRPARPPGDELVVGMVALFRPRKGTEVLLEALANALSHGHQVRLRAIGGFETPEYEQQIRQLVQQLGLERQVEFTGFTSNVAAELATLDVMVLPSLFGEGLPMVVLEAMAAGVPVVASHVEGASAAIEHRDTGLLVEPGSVSQLAEALEQFANGTIDLSVMAERGQQRHAECFSDVTMARGVAAVYRDVLDAS